MPVSVPLSSLYGLRWTLRAYWRQKIWEASFSYRKKSRHRVRAVLDYTTVSPKEKCLFLNDEIGRVMDSIFVSREWKDALYDLATATMKENNLTIFDFF